MADRVVNWNDFVSCADAVHLHLTHTEAAASPVSVSDALSFLRGHGRLFADTVVLADSCTPVISGPPGLGDYIVQEEDADDHIEIEDSTFDLIVEEGGWTDHALPLADTVSVADALIPPVHYTVNPADSVAVADSFSKLRTHGRSVVDSVTVSDSFVEKHVWTNYTVTPADSVTVADAQNAYLNSIATAYEVEETPTAPFELEEGSGFLELEDGGWLNHTRNPADTLTLADFLMFSGTAAGSGARVTRQVFEVAVTPADAPARLTRQVTELVVSPTAADTARITRQVAEVVTSPPPPPARLTRQVAEVMYSPDPPPARITRQVVEVVYSYTEPPFKPRAWMWF